METKEMCGWGLYVGVALFMVFMWLMFRDADGGSGGEAGGAGASQNGF
jgi:hypothetical protein